MRILLDEAHLGWDEAWDLTRPHARLHEPHASARGPGEVAGLALRGPPAAASRDRSTRSTAASSTTSAERYPGDEDRRRRMSLIEETPARKVRMAHLAVVGTHSTNGVAEIHSRLLRTHLLKDFAEMFPERFNNKTNGVTPRRWLLAGQSRRWRALVTESDRRRLDHRSRSSSAGSPRWPRTPAFRERFRRAKREAKAALRRLAARHLRAGRRSRHDLRLPDQADPRVQAAAAERAAHRDPLQPPAHGPGPGRSRRGRSSSPARRPRPTGSPN